MKLKITLISLLLTFFSSLLYAQPFSISGNVINDVNGLTDNTINGTGTDAGGGLTAVLVDAGTGNVVAATSVSPTGVFNFANQVAGTYIVRITTNSSVVGNPAPAVALPFGWVNTGEFFGTGVGSDGTVDGIVDIGTVSAATTNVNFGIEEPPVNGSGSNNAVNPGGTLLVVVPANTFTNAFVSTDAAPGSVTGIRIVSFPLGILTLDINGTAYTSGTFPGGGVTVPADASGNPTQTISVDPTVDGATAVTITFRAVDNADVFSTGTGNAILNLAGISISGNVFDDVNGLTDNTVNGLGTNAGGINAVLVDAITGNVVSSTAVGAGGTYTFTDQNFGDYNVIITTAAAVVGNPAPAITLPAGWIITGENVGAGVGSDGTPDGMIVLGNTTASTTDVNFGIEIIPVAGTGVNVAPNPGGTTQVTVPANTFTNTTLSSDVAPGNVVAIRITAFPAGATSIVINGTSYTSGTFPGAGVTVPADASGNPLLPITVDPTADGTTGVTISFVAVDNAGVESTNTGTANLNFAGVNISGNLFDDVNGLSDNTVNGLPTAAGGGVTAVLVDNITGNVVANTTAIGPGGAYAFLNQNAGDYTVLITTNTSVIGTPPPPVALPAGWADVGENIGTGVGSDGTPDGMLVLGVVNADLTDVNFGVEVIPVAGDGTNNALNPGGTTQVTVPANTFSNLLASSDAAPGGVVAIRITAFPTGATSIVINGISYTSGTFPVGGVVVPSDGAGSPTQTITVDPAANGGTNVTISFKAIDAAGVESTNTGAAVMVFGAINISGNVLDDADGLTNGVIDDAGTDAGGLNAVAVDDVTGLVAAVTTVQANGVYNLTNLSAGTYTVLITTNSATIGSAPPAVVLPAGWVNIGENLGAGPGDDGTVDGMLSVGTISADVSQANFGIDRVPVANPQTYVISYPALNSILVLNGTGAINSPAPLSGSDGEDGVFGTGETFNILDVSGLNGNTLSYLGVPITGPTTITNYDPDQLDVTFSGVGSYGLSFTYGITDLAGIASAAATYQITWSPSLPVTLLSFGAKAEGNNVRLNWQTSSEANSSYFSIEYSLNGRSYQEVGQVQAAGNSSQTINYAWLHTTAASKGILYYRLKVVDRDGQFKYSDVRIVRMDGNGKDLVVYPNPVVSSVNIILPKPGSVNSRVMIYSPAGQLVRTVVADQQQLININMQNLPGAVYSVVVIEDNKAVYKTTILKL